jgi:outer membrane immunogenic protein
MEPMKTALLTLAAVAIAAPAIAQTVIYPAQPRPNGYWEVTETTLVQVRPSNYGEAYYADVEPAAGQITRAAPRRSVARWEGLNLGVTVESQKGDTTYKNGNGSGNTFKDDGLGAGVHAGYTWQRGPVVYGFEGDLAGSGAEGDDGNSLGQVDEVTTNWHGSIRARVGLAAGPVMPYVTAGWAMENHEYQLTDPALGNKKFSEEDTVHGPTYGAGVEVAMTENTSARAEYRRTKYSEGKLFAGNLANSSRTYEREVDTLLFGFTYRMAPVKSRY